MTHSLLVVVAHHLQLQASASPQTQDISCKAYSIPMDSISCGTGYTGVKFPLKVKSCPSGLVTVGVTFDTSNCRQITTPGSDQETKCVLTPLDPSCTASPTPKSCPSGKYWVTTGSKIAHCVDVDPACPWGESLNHDFLGNPYCVPNTCPSNQVLQGDGISCGCSGGLVWDGGLALLLVHHL